MDKIWVKFLKDYESYKKDAVVQVEKSAGESLVNLKFAELTQPVGDKSLDDAMASLGDKFTKAIESATATAIKSINEKVTSHIKIPAVPVDHEEEGKKGFKSFGDFLTQVRSKNPDERLLNLHTKGDPSGMNTVDDAEGGFLVPETFASGIWDQVVDENPIFSRTDQRSTGGNNLIITAFRKDDLTRPYRYAGIRAYWMDEADQYTASQPQFRRLQLQLKKLGVLCYVTEEELADTSANTPDILQAKASDVISFEVNDALVNGTGVGKPLGLLRSEATVFVAPESGQQVDSELRMANIVKMYNRMPARFRSGAVWYMHPNIYEMLFYLSFRDNNTQPWPIFMPPSTGLTTAPNGTLLGRPIEVLDYLPAPGASGPIMFVNWSQYATLTKTGGGIKSASSMHVRFLYDEVAYKFSFRVDGQPLWLSPQVDLNGGVARSPFVALDQVYTAATTSGL